jgi:hypothetical protein
MRQPTSAAGRPKRVGDPRCRCSLLNYEPPQDQLFSLTTRAGLTRGRLMGICAAGGGISSACFDPSVWFVV